MTWDTEHDVRVVARRNMLGRHTAEFHEAVGALVDDLMAQRNRRCEELATEFLAACTPHEWGRVVMLHEFGDFDLGYPAPNGYSRVSSTEYVGFVVRPVELLDQRELGRWFTMTLTFRNHLATKGAI